MSGCALVLCCVALVLLWTAITVCSALERWPTEQEGRRMLATFCVALGLAWGPQTPSLSECARGAEWHRVAHGAAACLHGRYLGTWEVSDAHCVSSFVPSDSASCRHAR